MKILLVSNALTGGAGKACIRLYNAFSKIKGLEVKLLYLEGGKNSDPNLISFYPNVRTLFVKQIINIPILYIRKMIYNLGFSHYRIPRSIHKIENHPLVDWADVINLHWVADFIDYRNFFKQVSKPVVWTMHDMLPFSGGYHFKIDRIRYRANIEKRIEKKKYLYIRQFNNLSIVAPSQWLLDISKEYLPFYKRSHTRIFNTLDHTIYKSLDKNFAREVLNLPINKKIIVFSAHRIGDHRKGMDLLISALNMINYPDLHLVAVGSGGIDLDIKHSITELGQINDEYTMSLVYAAADLSVVPSREDNMPNTIIESLSCGCPVISFSTGGIPELIFDSNVGLLAPNIESNDLANVILLGLKNTWDKSYIINYITSQINEKIIAQEYLNEFLKFSKYPDESI